MNSKQSLAILLLFLVLAVRGIAQSSTTFQYDTKGNQISAIYAGTNPCPINLATPPSDGMIEAESLADRSTSQASSAPSTADRKEEAALSVTPNPASGQVSIQYFVPEEGEVSVCLFSVSGRLIARVGKGWHQAGWHQVFYDMEVLEAGAYFYRLSLAQENISATIVKQ